VHRQFVAGDLEGALEDYRFIGDLYPDSMVPHNNSGRILTQMGRYEDAAAAYERAHGTDPRSAVPLWNLWWLAMQRLKDPQTAERTARALMALLPDNANAAHGLAWSLVMQRRFPDVLAKARAGQLRTGVAHATLCLALALRAQGREDEAQEVLLEAVATARREQRGKSPTPGERVLLAALLAAAGRSAEARALADRTASSPTLDADDRHSLALAYAQVRDLERARHLWQEALEGGYGDPYAILVDPALAAIRDDPAVDRLLPPVPPA
jgi:tetratricopeptide (TPR) repeat protein